MYQGIRLIDEEGEYIVNESWCTWKNVAIVEDNDGWETREIPKGEEIVGFKCRRAKNMYALADLSFQLHRPFPKIRPQ